MSEQREPVRTCQDLETLNDAEVLEGYWEGRQNGPCGDNRSRSFWHGWRNGMIDGHHMQKDDAASALAREFVAHKREARGVWN